jgi:hypothetical protein
MTFHGSKEILEYMTIHIYTRVCAWVKGSQICGCRRCSRGIKQKWERWITVKRKREVER